MSTHDVKQTTDAEVYVAYLILKQYCESRECQYCIFCQNKAPCCAFYDRSPNTFPELNLGEHTLREMLMSIERTLEHSLEKKRL